MSVRILVLAVVVVLPWLGRGTAERMSVRILVLAVVVVLPCLRPGRRRTCCAGRARSPA